MSQTKGSGLPENVTSALTYVLGIVSAIVFMTIEKESKTVKFHAFQSIAFCVVAIVGWTILTIIPFIGWVLLPLWSIAVTIVWLLCMIKAYQKSELVLPYITDWAKKQAAK